MEVDIFTLCDAATESGGKLSVMGAFDIIFSPTAPAIHPQCAIAARLRFFRIEQGEHKLILHIVDEDGKILINLNGDIDVKLPNDDLFGSISFILNLQRMRLEKFGEHAVNLAVDGLQVKSFPFFFKQVKSST